MSEQSGKVAPVTEPGRLRTLDDVECAFCDLIHTGDAKWVTQEEHAVAFLPLAHGTLAPGHTLVVPRAHSDGILDTGDVAFAAVMGLVRRVSRSLVEGLGAEGVVILNASGPASGRSVDHLHLHVVPCWHDDEATFWPSDRSTHVLLDTEPVHDKIATAYQRLYSRASWTRSNHVAAKT